MQSMRRVMNTGKHWTTLLSLRTLSLHSYCHIGNSMNSWTMMVMKRLFYRKLVLSAMEMSAFDLIAVAVVAEVIIDVANAVPSF